MNHTHHRPPWLRRPGFTLVEIMIVVVIIGLLAAMAIPAIQKVQRRSKNSRFVSDLRIFTTAFETYALETGGWPPNVGPAAVPAGLSTSLQVNVWRATSVVGGNWNYDRNLFGVAVAVSVSGGPFDAAQMQEIDAKIDDGDVTTGHFQLNNGRYMYILEP